MDGGRVLPAVESERPARILPPMPTQAADVVDAPPKLPLKQRFQKAFAAVGGNSEAESSAANGVEHSNGVAEHGSNGTSSMTMTQPIARQMASPAPPAVRKAPNGVPNGAAPVTAPTAEPMVAKLVRKLPKPAVLPSPVPAPSPARVGQSSGQSRRARLRLTRVDPWSVMKTAFLLSVALGIVTVVSVLIVWSVLGSAGVWDSVNETVKGVVGDSAGSKFNIEDYVGMNRILGFTALVAVIDVVLLTAIATLSAFLYNMAAALLGGLEVTLVEDH